MSLPTHEESINEAPESHLETIEKDYEMCSSKTKSPSENISFPIDMSNSACERKSTSFVQNQALLMNQEDILSAIPKPLDGGYGWVILFSSFFLNAVAEGVSLTYAIFLEPLTIHFATTIEKACWVGALMDGISWISGPLSSALINTYGFRTTAISGSVLYTCAIALGTLSPNIEILILMHGILGGIGVSLMRFAAVLSVGYYFSSKRALATGISMCGGSIGIIVLAPFIQKALDVYAWPGATILLAGIILNATVFGALLRPLKSKVKDQQCKEFQTQFERKTSGLVMIRSMSNTEGKIPARFSNINDLGSLNEAQNDDIKLNFYSRNASVATRESLNILYTNSFPSELQTQRLSDKSEIANVVIPDVRKGRMSICLESLPRKSIMALDASAQPISQRKKSIINISTISAQPGSIHRLSIDWKNLNRPLYRKDIFYRGSIATIPKFRNSVVDANSYLASVTTIPLNEDYSQDNSLKKPHALLNYLKLPISMLDVFEGLFDASLFRNIPYLCICVSSLIAYAAHLIPMMFLSNRAIHRGINPGKASSLLSLLGMGSAAGRMFFNLITTIPNLQAKYVYNTGMFISGVCVFIIPFTSSFTSMMLIALAYGFFSSTFTATFTLVLTEVLGLDMLTNACGVLGIFQGVGIMIGPPIAASIADLTRNEAAAFFFGTGLYLFASIVMFIGFRNKCNESKMPC